MTASSPPVAARNDQNNDTPAAPFPAFDSPSESATPSSAPNVDPTRVRNSSNSSALQERLRAASNNFKDSSPPVGFSVATAQMANVVPSISDIRRGSYGADGWSGKGQVAERERRASLTRAGSQISDDALPQNTPEHHHPSLPAVEETEQSRIAANASRRSNEKSINLGSSESSNQGTIVATESAGPEIRTAPFDNGYQFPPKHSWGEATKIFLLASWKFFITPIGFLVVIYGLNIVAWGGMLFLLLCNASPAMCKPTCNDINSPRRIWIEIDSQILNSLFCVTGFGTIPWRFRDLYYLMQYRIQKKEIGLRRLAGINRGWFRLAGSQDLPVKAGPDNIETEFANLPESAIAFPSSKTPNAPLTGVRAPATALWKLDFVIWTMVWNTFLQAVLSGFMWGMNRYDRPSWSTGLFVALACIVAGAGGIMSFIEGNHVKAIEGVPVSEKDQQKLAKDKELGITHFNNIKDEKPKDKKDKKDGTFKRKENLVEGTSEEAVEVDKQALQGAAASLAK